MGLVKEGSGVAANVLGDAGIDLRRIRLEIEKIIQTGVPSGMMGGKLPLTPRAKKVVEYAISEAADLRHNYVGTEHVLLAMLREGEGVAGHVLEKSGVTRESVLEAISGLGATDDAMPNAKDLVMQTDEYRNIDLTFYSFSLPMKLADIASMFGVAVTYNPQTDSIEEAGDTPDIVE